MHRMPPLRPDDAAQVQLAVADALAAGTRLEIIAGGSKAALGGPVVADQLLDLSAISGIVDYDPAELVLTARAATPMAEIAQALAAARQILAFEPPDWRALLGSAGTPTLGGAISCNLGGPRRVRAGAARDHLLGYAGVNGWADAYCAGGQVVKNVTGYDLCKLMAGAHGTLSVLTEISVKVLPAPEISASLVLHGLDDATAIAALAHALASPHEVSGAAHLPGVPGASDAQTVLRLEGPAPSVAFRADALRDTLHRWRPGLAMRRLEDAPSRSLWAEIAQAAPVVAAPGLLWRVFLPPSAAPALVAEWHAARERSPYFYDWGGALLWLATLGAAAAELRAAAARHGGHAMLFRAPAEARAAIGVFTPQTGALAALGSRVKAAFDPHHLLNPGRMAPAPQPRPGA